MNKSAFQIVRFVSEEAIREKLEKGDVPPESVEHLYDFGKLVAGQAHQVGTDLNAKLGNCLTWTSALLGMQLVSFSNGEHRLPLLFRSEASRRSSAPSWNGSKREAWKLSHLDFGPARHAAGVIF